MHQSIRKRIKPGKSLQRGSVTAVREGSKGPKQRHIDKGEAVGGANVRWAVPAGKGEAALS